MRPWFTTLYHRLARRVVREKLQAVHLSLPHLSAHVARVGCGCVVEMKYMIIDTVVGARIYARGGGA